MAYLKVVGGPHVGQIMELKPSGAVIGRLPECEIALKNPEVSRRHARFAPFGAQCFIEDLGSRNGTFVNDRRVGQRAALRDGDRVRVCEAEFEYHAGDPYDSLRADKYTETAAVLATDDAEPVALVAISAEPNAAENHGTARSRDSLVAERQALLEITKRLRATLALDEVLPQILETLAAIFPIADRGFIALRDEDGEVKPRWVREWHAPCRAGKLVSRTIVRRVMDTCQAIISADTVVDASLSGIDSLKATGAHSLMCAPLIDAYGRAFGVLQLDACSSRARFQEQHLEMLLAVASQAAIAIENSRLHEQVTQERARERDREVAEHIQRSFLPKSRPSLAGYQFYDFYQPASHVGGDFYTYVPMPHGRVVAAVADVSGHGMAAAMLTARLAAEIPLRLLATDSAVAAANELNALLTAELLDDHFITLLFAVLDPANRLVTLVNAGHMSPLLRLADGTVATLAADEADFPLGVDTATTYRAAEARLPPGSVLVLYSDGITDTINQAGELYTTARLGTTLEQTRGGARETGLAIMKDLRAYAAGQPPIDDMCLVCLGCE